MNRLASSLAATFVALQLAASGAVPTTITHQGRIAVDGVNFDGNGGFKFLIYEAPSAGGAGAVALWKNTSSAPANLSPPSNAVAVTIDRGLYSVALGEGMAPLPDSLDPETPGNKLFLRIWFSDGAHGFQQLSPDQELRSVVFAKHAEDANSAETADSALSVPAGTIDETMLADDAVTSDKLAPGSIGSEQLDPLGVAGSIASLGGGVISTNPNAGTLLGDGYIRLGEIEQPDWEAISAGVEPPVARKGHSLVWTGTHVIMWGGIDAALTRYDEGYRFDFASNTWSPISTDGAPQERAYHTAVWTGDKMIVWGGLKGDELDDGGIYDPATDTWAPLPSPPAALGKRQNHNALWTGDTMLVWGGLDLDFTNGHVYYDNGAAFDPATGLWSAITTTGAPVGRERNPAVWTGTKMIVWGGLNGSNFSIDDGGVYDPAPDTWTPIPAGTANAPSGRFHHSGVWSGSEFIVWGGFVNGVGNVADGAAFDPDTGAWRTIAAPPAALTPRTLHSAHWTGSEMVIVGGEGIFPNQEPMSSAAYDPVGDTWRSLPNADVRSEHPGVWTGTAVFVAGGVGSAGGLLGTAQFWSESANLWVDVAAAVAPTARYGHVTLWTGDELLIWGGIDESFNGDADFDALYNPGTGSWRNMSNTGTPPALNYTASCWTGSEMIVWGGGGGGDATSDAGGRYNPTSDTWASISSTGAPTGRNDHTGIWTGTEFIIWGGYDGTYTNTGARYDPATDSWTTMSTVGAPAGRERHTAVWTGTEMIVWGGDVLGARFQDGARYDPATDLWTAMTTTDAPDPRFDHTAVWTGDEMIVWAGSASPGGRVHNGARYDPATDTWTAVAEPGYGERSNHAAVWTGEEMLIWGGQGNLAGAGIGPDSGMLYDPLADRWRPGPNEFEPLARGDTSFAWTGERFAIWGGRLDGTTVSSNTGAFLNLKNKLYIYAKP